MQGITATVHNGKIELDGLANWPDGTKVEITPVPAETPGPQAEPNESYHALMQRLAGSFGAEPFERPDQGEFETREDW